MQSFEELKSGADSFREQLVQINGLLATDAENKELLQMKAEVEEVLLATESILQAALEGEEVRQEEKEDGQKPSLQDGAQEPLNTQTAFISPAMPPSRPANIPAEGQARLGLQGKVLKGRGQMHPKNKYSETPPHFTELAAEYPSFAKYVFYGKTGKPNIEWTDFNATRELTKTLLDKDFGVKWWIPSGQLCPTVTNRANYIHWLEDLLTLSSPKDKPGPITGLDIGTGANLIYPLLGASLNGWKFVATDITPVALEWAKKNVDANPHLNHLIEVRSAAEYEDKEQADLGEHHPTDKVLVGVVKEDERFDFCMCNPPFFESMEAANANPHTACGGTPTEMVCEGGEDAFIRKIISDSLQLKDQIHWYTSMVGRKVNLKGLISTLKQHRVGMIRTTEFVQGRTSRWGLAWSFAPDPDVQAAKVHAEANPPPRTKLSFLLEGLRGQKGSAGNVLSVLAEELQARGATCTLKDPVALVLTGTTPAFTTATTVSDDSGRVSFKRPAIEEVHFQKAIKRLKEDQETSTNSAEDEEGVEQGYAFRVSIFQQAPGALTVMASLHNDLSKSTAAGSTFSRLFNKIGDDVRLRLKG